MSTILELSPDQAQMSPDELDFGRNEAARVSAPPATTGKWEYSATDGLAVFSSNLVFAPGGDDWHGEEAQTDCHQRT